MVIEEHEGADQRCGWASSTAEMTTYHDEEWGFPVTEDRRLFEKLILEAFQSGLSWRTILAKRPAFRRAFADFAIDSVAAFTPVDVERLLADAAIIRHRGKIEAVVNNAARAVDLIDEQGSLAAYLWSYEPDRPAPPSARATSPESTALARDLKRRGWRFVGPTTAYAFMQAMGLVNDHESTCISRPAVESARASFSRPT
jgi:DNA-3-methyladenine glycosylase I